MRKALLLVSILSISVFSTACINNFAVQELNNKAKVYLEQGDYQGAIERLKSSIDLDDTIFESHYNLAVAYTQAEDYQKAILSYQKAAELKPEFPDVYYSLAVAQESLVTAIDKGEVLVSDSGEVTVIEKDAVDFSDNLSKSERISVGAAKLRNSLLSDAILNYKKYLEVAVNPPDATDVNAKIKFLEDKIGKDKLAEDEVR